VLVKKFFEIIQIRIDTHRLDRLDQFAKLPVRFDKGQFRKVHGTPQQSRCAGYEHLVQCVDRHVIVGSRKRRDNIAYARRALEQKVLRHHEAAGTVFVVADDLPGVSGILFVHVREDFFGVFLVEFAQQVHRVAAVQFAYDRCRFPGFDVFEQAGRMRIGYVFDEFGCHIRRHGAQHLRLLLFIEPKESAQMLGGIQLFPEFQQTFNVVVG
jgi:hypothetical protein